MITMALPVIIPAEYRKTKTEMDVFLKDVVEHDITPTVLLMIDYAYHNTDDNYDDGLSFLDRLHKKLSRYFDLQWNIPKLKYTVRTSSNPFVTYRDMLNEIVTPRMIAIYGV